MKPISFLSALYQDHPALCIDVGARGGFRLLPALHQYAEVHMVEPDPDSAEILRKAHFPFRKSQIHQLGLSDSAGFAKLNITREGSMSSLLEPGKIEFVRGFGEMKNSKSWVAGIEVAKAVEVETQTLAGFHEQTGNGFVDFLKLDTQGNELDILRSGETLLRSGLVGVICCEVAYFEIYKGQAYFSEVDLFLRKCGFRFIECRSYPEVLEREDEFSASSKLYERPKHAPVGDAWYSFNWSTENAEQTEQRKRTACVLACEGYYSEAKYLLDGILKPDEQNELFRYLSEPTRESGFKHFLRRWTPPAIQQWRAKRRR